MNFSSIGIKITKMKLEYISPSISVTLIKMEESLAAGSTFTVSGGNGSDFTPDIADWNNTDAESKGFEF